MNFSRAILILLSISLLSGSVFILTKEYRDAKLRNLNFFYLHEYGYLYEVEKSTSPIDVLRLEKYKAYYRKLTQYKPDLAEAYMLLGFCNFYLNDLAKAENAFDKAVNLKLPLPAVYYNLGVINYKKGDYLAAVKILKPALEIDLSQMMVFISRSKVYLDIITSNGDFVKENQQRLLDQYSAIYKLLILCFYHLQDEEQMFFYFKQAVSQFNNPDFFKPSSNNALMGVRLF